MSSGHHRGEILWGEEGRRGRLTPRLQRVRCVPHAWFPERIVDDAVHVGVVLAEIAGGILQVPEEVRSNEVAPEAPGVPIRVGLSIAVAPRPTSSTSSTCHEVWCRNDTGAC